MSQECGKRNLVSIGPRAPVETVKGVNTRTTDPKAKHRREVKILVSIGQKDTAGTVMTVNTHTMQSREVDRLDPRLDHMDHMELVVGRLVNTRVVTEAPAVVALVVVNIRVVTGAVAAMVEVVEVVVHTRPLAPIGKS